MNKSLNSFTKTVLAAGITGAAAATWATVIERNLFAVRQKEVAVLPSGAAPLRVAHISDLHLAPWQDRKIDWLRQQASLQPDIVVLTGDLTGHKESIEAVRYALKPLIEAAETTVFVHGSNDYYGPVFKNPLKYLKPHTAKKTKKQPDIDNDRLTAMLEDLGALNLNNRSARSHVGEHEIEWLGLGDPHIKLDDTAALEANLKENEISHQRGSALRFGVVHAPYANSLNELTDRGAQLIFAGHTHGGQLRIPGFGALTSNSDLPNAQARGLSVWYTAQNAAFLNVSAGLGTAITAPARFACRPEISLLTLV
ncbi:metallophosphoesterase [Canibacter zhoujuaniae]|uniref:metallophosphoesterase n=1 Tax=Canibacter zhoujuaniae TaxID=2708343 RepID=UPI0014220A52|nr:metallophosphoesterase [Canibacter zhoujuaniae]